MIRNHPILIARRAAIVSGWLMVVAVETVVAQTPLGTSFTYQGSLSAPGMPAVTNADFQFTLYDATENGAQVGTMLTKDNVALVKGVFTVSLDFGAAAFTGNARWLQVAVRSPAGAGTFTTLTPRQPITATPQATYASQTRGIEVDADGHLGVGVAPVPGFGTRVHADGNVAVTSGFGFFVRNPEGTGNNGGLRSDPNGDVSLYSGGNPQMYLTAEGNVGMGVNHPGAKLHVRNISTVSNPAVAIEGNGQAFMRFLPQGQGNILTTGDIGFPHFDEPVLYIRNFDPAARIAFSGAEGTRYPPSGMEDLRILRGRILGDGTIEAGLGFTVARADVGEYVITYTQPFSGDPSVTATVNSAGFSAAFVEMRANSATSCAPQVIRRSDGNHVDGHFNFIAIGPR